MNAKSFEKWQAIEDEFLNSDLNEVAFCKSRKLNLEWFRQKLSDAERREQKTKQQNPKNLFVELIPQSEAFNILRILCSQCSGDGWRFDELR